MVDTIYTNDSGAAFIQLEGVGPNDLTYLGCHDFGDMEEPRGDVERTYCPDPRQRGAWVVQTRSQGASGEVTFDVTLPLGRTADAIELASRTRCSSPMYVAFNQCAQRNLFGNWQRAMVIKAPLITSASRSNYAGRNADGAAPPEASKTFSFSASEVVDVFELEATRRAVAATVEATDIHFVDFWQCLGACGKYVAPATYGVAVTVAAGAAKALVYVTANGGVTWTATAAQPLAVALDLSSVLYIMLPNGTRRIIAARGTTLAGTPAQNIVSDDDGATWSTVNVGAVNTEFVPGRGLMTYDGQHIFAVTDTGAGAAGNIYKSSDWGATWTLMFSGAGDALNYVYTLNEKHALAVGDTNEILVTRDGGVIWTAVTGPAAQAAVDALCCGMASDLIWYVGYEDGDLYYTADGGTTWELLVLELPVGFTCAHVYAIRLTDEHNVWLGVSLNDGADDFGAVMRSVSGGAPRQWETWLYPEAATAGDGATGLAAVNYNKAFTAGHVGTTTATILEIAE